MSRPESSHDAELMWWLWREKVINSLRFNDLKTWHCHTCSGISSDFLDLLVLMMIVCGVGVAAVVQSINACHRTSRVLETDLIALKLVCDEQLWDSNHFETHRAAWSTCYDRHQLVHFLSQMKVAWINDLCCACKWVRWKDNKLLWRERRIYTRSRS